MCLLVELRNRLSDEEDVAGFERWFERKIIKILFLSSRIGWSSDFNNSKSIYKCLENFLVWADLPKVSRNSLVKKEHYFIRNFKAFRAEAELENVIKTSSGDCVKKATVTDYEIDLNVGVGTIGKYY